MWYTAPFHHPVTIAVIVVFFWSLADTLRFERPFSVLGWYERFSRWPFSIVLAIVAIVITLRRIFESQAFDSCLWIFRYCFHRSHREPVLHVLAQDSEAAYTTATPITPRPHQVPFRRT